MDNLKDFVSGLNIDNAELTIEEMKIRGDSIVNGQLKIGGNYGTLYGDYVDISNLSDEQKLRVIQWFGFRGVPLSFNSLYAAFDSISDIKVLYNAYNGCVHWSFDEQADDHLKRKICFGQVAEDLDKIDLEKIRRESLK